MTGAATLRFSKMHGAGNDFVVLDLRGGRPAPTPALARALGDRHAGVGFDQLLTIEDPGQAGAVARYRIWNADGSAAQQCGNGARCVAAWLQRDGAAAGDAFVLEAPPGPVTVQALGAGRYALALGRPRFEPADLPFLADAAQASYRLDVDGEAVGFGIASMGNPHAVLEVPDVATAEVGRLGPGLQARAEFPEGVNVGFAQVLAPDRIRLRVYERGAGETLACGSGACAAVAVLARRGRVGRHVFVELPGGTLEITWPGDDSPVTMAGPTAFVFEGDFLLEQNE
ncbi:diaminopimelate epimerase [Arenimonas donghaensis]|uniref:Diaminopimelate epimerase n=1 Tax=Arenimonas donghaensis DSM 18148 = HO3-R19 TaxID=1121014 RepID=A0A087MKZ6_9GAMM|nr:diaminopimelate epimerase [Arenimonas donghaensis]KFL37549.1 hypothetical protein N788_09180 [Arenimonas donghaensis DSM 18148 = HO3-R19]